MPADSEDDSDSVLSAERAYLARSREYLRVMREEVLALNPEVAAADRLNLQFLLADLHRRAEALKDLPDAPLFFGRLNYAEAPWETTQRGSGTVVRPDPQSGSGGPGDAPRESTVGGRPPGLALHIGRRHVHDRDGTPVVIDWRAPVSVPFYRASPADPMGVDLRRRFGFDGGKLTAYEDERFGASAPEPAGAPGRTASRLLVAEIERPRSGPMRDIVATIQPEQDDIVRAEAARSICVQGAPGTGKTAVGLHRVAYLLYAYKEQVTRGGVVVVGPNAAFLSYIRNVLPALGELDVAQTTVAGLAASVPVKGPGGRVYTDTPEAAAVKADARMAEVLHRALWSALREPDEALVLARGSRRWRVSAYEIGELAGELKRRGVRYGAGRELLGHRIAHVILTQMEAAGETCDDRTHDAVRRSAPVRAAVIHAWPKTDAKRLVHTVLSDPARLAAAADGILTGDEQKAIVWRPAPRGPGSAKWSRADQVLIDEAADLIERTPSLAHVVLDEAQDLSPMELRAVGRRCSTGAATVLGDVAQGTTPWATTSWDTLLAHLGKPDAVVQELDVGYRVPRQILDYASRLLPSIAPGLRPAASLRSDPASLTVRPVADGALEAEIEKECRQALRAPGSVAVICADPMAGQIAAALRTAGLSLSVLGAPAPPAKAAGGPEHGVAGGPEHGAVGEPGQDTGGQVRDTGDGRLTVVPVTLAKGLEYDHVVLAEPGRIAAGETYGLRRLYVALTRAVSRLTVLHVESLPRELCYVP
ncbi:MAG: ATP-binding domain-containing protein [Nocardiopsaceae bacterium]|nr:ATP-binding domain-containing protein [Nocardiopsaceae bacterium]